MTKRTVIATILTLFCICKTEAKAASITRNSPTSSNSTTARSTPNCNFAAEDAIVYGQLILNEVQEKPLASTKKQMSRIEEPLFCLLQIQRESGGFLKALTEEVLQPLLGGPQNKGLLEDSRYKSIAALIKKWALKHPVRGSLLEAHAQGSWDFYRQFCGEGRLAACREFIPDAESIESQSSVLGASSLLMLEVAYLSLSGEDQDYVAQRIKDLHSREKLKDPLKQKVLDKIYHDIFQKPHRLS